MRSLQLGGVAGGERHNEVRRTHLETLPDLTLEARVRLAEFVAL